MCLILGLIETVGIRLRISKELWEVGEFDVGVEVLLLHRRLSTVPAVLTRLPQLILPCTY